MDQQPNQENVQTRSMSSNEPNGYSKMLQKSVEVMKTQYADVNFLFDCDGDVIKVRAHKCVLATSSSVFNAMFNGELKEKGDVEIKDAPPAVFEEFLNFFYGKPMQLSMENVADVLQLADKYDVEDCVPICVDFLKENLTIDDIVWVLHLALRFELKELRLHCKNEIRENFEKVWALFDVKEDESVQLLAHRDDRFLSEKDIERIFHHICAMSKNIVSKLSEQVDRLRVNRLCVIPFDLVKDRQERLMITDQEIIRFELSGGSLMLTDLFCSNVFDQYNDTFDLNFDLRIQDISMNPFRLVYAQNIKIVEYGENHVKFTSPIHIERDHKYSIVMNLTDHFDDEDEFFTTYSAQLPTEPVELTPTVKISFPYWSTEGNYTRSLIARMYFEPTTEIELN